MRKIKSIILVITIILPSYFRIRLLNLLGFKINLKAKIKPFSVILANNMSIKAFAKIDSFVVITSLDRLVMYEYSAIQRFTYISGNHSLNLNKRSLIGSRCIINTNSGEIEIGEYSALAPRTSIYTHGTFLPITLGYSNKNKGVRIGDFCWIMQNTSIGPGVTIESNSIILPGSTIVKKIPGNLVVYDTPVERKTFPINIFKIELNATELINLIKQIAIKYFETLHSKNSKLEYSVYNEVINIRNRKNKNYQIIISDNISDFSTNSKDITQIYFYYNLNLEIMKKKQFICYDFKRIINSYPKLPEILNDFDEFVFFNYGLKFIDVDYL